MIKNTFFYNIFTLNYYEKIGPKKHIFGIFDKKVNCSEKRVEAFLRANYTQYRAITTKTIILALSGIKAHNHKNIARDFQFCFVKKGPFFYNKKK